VTRRDNRHGSGGQHASARLFGLGALILLLLAMPALAGAADRPQGASPGALKSPVRTSACDEDAPYMPGEVLVKLKDGQDRTQASTLAADHGCQVQEGIATIRLYRMKILDQRSVREVAAEFAKDPRVEYAEPNFIDHPTGNRSQDSTNRQEAPQALPTDPRYGEQWHYRLIHLPDAWSVTTGSTQVIVANVDTGVRFDHPDLAGRLSGNGYDFIDGDSDPTDPGPSYSHGTHTSGTIAAATNNAAGGAGVTWTGTILPIRGIGSHFQMAQAFRYAAGLLVAPDPVNPTPAQVINYSAGGSSSATKEEAVSDVNDAGVIMVCAAGNDSCGSVIYPAAYSATYPMVIAVGATDYNYGSLPQRAPYSNCGAEVNVVAPGGDTTEDTDGDGNPDGVLSTAWDYGTSSPTYEFWQGTSMATPHVTGLVALMLARGIPAAGVRSILQTTAVDLGTAGFDNEYGWGLIDAAAALQNPNRLAVFQTGYNTTNSVQRALTEMGRGVDLYVTADFSSLALSPYGTVIVAMDGGEIGEASIQNLAAFAEAGGNLVMLGGSQWAPFANAVDIHLLNIDETSYVWDAGDGSPDLKVTNSASQLARNLPAAHDFGILGTTYYMLRSQDTAATVAAVNGDGLPALLKKKLSKGTLSWFINSPYDAYWADPSDYALLKQVIDNCLGVSFPSPDKATRGLVWALGNLWNVDSGDGNSVYGKKIYKIDVETGAPIAAFDAPGDTPLGLTFDGTYFWCSAFGTNTIYKLDPTDLHVLSSFPSPRSSPAGLAWDGHYLWLAILQTGPIIKIDPATGLEVGSIPAPGPSPRPFGLTYVRGFLYVGDDGSDTIYKVSPRSGAVVDSRPAPGIYPAGLAFDGTFLWVADWDSSRIYRMEQLPKPRSLPGLLPLLLGY
jgi:subtilisin family serine protease